jgi:hypothetical protein
VICVACTRTNCTGIYLYQMTEHNLNKGFIRDIYLFPGQDICSLGNRLLFVGGGMPGLLHDNDPADTLGFEETTLLELNDPNWGPSEDTAEVVYGADARLRCTSLLMAKASITYHYVVHPVVRK